MLNAHTKIANVLLALALQLATLQYTNSRKLATRDHRRPWSRFKTNCHSVRHRDVTELIITYLFCVKAWKVLLFWDYTLYNFFRNYSKHRSTTKWHTSVYIIDFVLTFSFFTFLIFLCNCDRKTVFHFYIPRECGKKCSVVMSNVLLFASCVTKMLDVLE